MLRGNYGPVLLLLVRDEWATNKGFGTMARLFKGTAIRARQVSMQKDHVLYETEAFRCYTIPRDAVILFKRKEGIHGQA